VLKTHTLLLHLEALHTLAQRGLLHDRTCIARLRQQLTPEQVKVFNHAAKSHAGLHGQLERLPATRQTPAHHALPPAVTGGVGL
jgi:hypothetical protein